MPFSPFTPASVFARVPNCPEIVLYAVVLWQVSLTAAVLRKSIQTCIVDRFRKHSNLLKS